MHHRADQECVILDKERNRPAVLWPRCSYVALNVRLSFPVLVPHNEFIRLRSSPSGSNERQSWQGLKEQFLVSPTRLGWWSLPAAWPRWTSNSSPPAAPPSCCATPASRSKTFPTSPAFRKCSTAV